MKPNINRNKQFGYKLFSDLKLYLTKIKLNTKKLFQDFNILEVIKFFPEYVLELMRNRVDSFDQRYGIDTKSPVSIIDLDVANETAQHAELYWPTNEINFRKLIDAIKIPRKDFTFIDLGSGKGRALMLAADFDFKQIIGVEFSKKLSDIAEKNIAIFKKQKDSASKIKIQNEDAANFCFPKGPLFIYLFDPFRSEVMEQVIVNLLASLKNDPREVYVAYYLPMHKDLFIKYGFSTTAEQPRNLRLDYPWIIFHKNKAAALNVDHIETSF